MCKWKAASYWTRRMKARLWLVRWLAGTSGECVNERRKTLELLTPIGQRIAPKGYETLSVIGWRLIIIARANETLSFSLAVGNETKAVIGRRLFSWNETLLLTGRNAISALERFYFPTKTGKSRAGMNWWRKSLSQCREIFNQRELVSRNV